jgi:PAS domain S-box-containing protein
LKKPSDLPENWDSLREKIIGLGERSLRKSYYPELQQQLEALRASEEKYRLLVSNIPAVVFKGYADDTVDFFDDKIEALTGYAKEDFLSRRLKWTDIILEEDSKGFRKVLIDAFKSDKSYVRDYRVKTKDQRVIWIQERGRIFFDQEDRISHIDGVFFDITERKTLEAQLVQAQKMEAVGRLAGGLAHDFNNLLTAISGYGELMLWEFPEDAPRRGYLEEIIRTTERASALTRQLLAFSRKQIIQPRIINLNELISKMEKMLRRLLGEDLDLITLLDPALAAVKADPGQMDQVIMNLAVNAREAMPRGGLLTIETENVFLDETYARDHLEVIPGPYVMLAVSDTGIGMDAATQAHIFEPFFTTKEPGKGTGLGLSTVHGIVKQSGGHIWFYSEPGKGTTFKIYLPRVEEAAMPLHPVAAPATSLRGPETILVAEDNEGLRRVICQTLRLYGYTVLEARHGNEAILVFGRHKGPIHLVLTDVVMPGMSGGELMERLSPFGRKAKVLFMSGYTEDTLPLRSLLAAGVPFLEKPFKSTDLVQKVREVLDFP